VIFTREKVNKNKLILTALMIIFGFHAKYAAFSKCFPKKRKEQNHSSASPLFTLLEVGYMPHYLQPLHSINHH
jgi:hypothetical protein